MLKDCIAFIKASVRDDNGNLLEEKFLGFEFVFDTQKIPSSHKNSHVFEYSMSFEQAFEAFKVSNFWKASYVSSNANVLFEVFSVYHSGAKNALASSLLNKWSDWSVLFPAYPSTNSSSPSNYQVTLKELMALNLTPAVNQSKKKSVRSLDEVIADYESRRHYWQNLTTVKTITQRQKLNRI